jgi:putative hemolysin
VLTEISIVILLTLINGVLAMSELAVLSSRPVRLKLLADQGNRGAAVAIRLAEDPGRFLSTVQIGITLVGVLSGAFSGATLGARLAGWLQAQGLSEAVADGLGVGSVVVAITYLSLIVGELVPKQIALKAPEVVASKVAPAMAVLSKVAMPLVWLLSASGKAVLALLGQKGETDERMSDEEIRTVLAEAHNAGVIETGESEMISGVMRLADRAARGLMTPRRDVEVIDIEDDLAEIREQLRNSQKSRLPVRNGSSDEILGVLFVKDALDAFLQGTNLDVRSLMRDAPVVSDRTSVSDAARDCKILPPCSCSQARLAQPPGCRAFGVPEPLRWIVEPRHHPSALCLGNSFLDAMESLLEKVVTRQRHADERGLQLNEGGGTNGLN